MRCDIAQKWATAVEIGRRTKALAKLSCQPHSSLECQVVSMGQAWFGEEEWRFPLQ